MPLGLRNAGALALRYSAQTYGYLFLVTGNYPYSGPCVAPPSAPATPAVPMASPRCLTLGAGRASRAPAAAGAARDTGPAGRRRAVGLGSARALELGCSAVGAPAGRRADASILHESFLPRSASYQRFLGIDAPAGERHTARRARRLRPARAPPDARVGGGPGRHRDAARDARLRGRLAGRSCRSDWPRSGGSGATRSPTRAIWDGSWRASSDSARRSSSSPRRWRSPWAWPGALRRWWWLAAAPPSSGSPCSSPSSVPISSQTPRRCAIRMLADARVLERARGWRERGSRSRTSTASPPRPTPSRPGSARRGR